jgi:dolichol-phosphate mannosyltransferase
MTSASHAPRKLLSVVIPVYFNEKSLPRLLERLKAALGELKGYETEFVFVDDGSPDGSLRVLLELQKTAGGIRIVRLTRNFGSMAAVQAGFLHARGDCVAMITADLQDPPELIPEMLRHWESGKKTVFAVRQGRKDPWLSALFAKTYYWLLRRWGVRGFPPGGFDFVLLDREVVNQLNAIQEKNTHLMPLIFWLGHDHALIPYTRGKRAEEYGKSRWTFGKKLKLFIDSFVSFSYAPIRALSFLGAALVAAACLTALAVLLAWRHSGRGMEGWGVVSLLLIFFSGLQLLSMGLIGEYLWRTLDASRNRPSFVIDKIYE